MRFFRPFWLYRILDRVESFVICAARFPHRVWRYRCVLAHDYDFDWEALAEFMELKLRAMSEVQASGLGVHSHIRARECRVAAELCRRLREDVWFDMHGTGSIIQSHRIRQSEQIAQEYLGRLIGKRLMWWWD